jgi:hypothetical protein
MGWDELVEGERMGDKIPTEKMDAVDRQQQADIDNARSLALGALFTSALTSILFFGAFIMAMWEMGQAIRVLEKLVKP